MYDRKDDATRWIKCISYVPYKDRLYTALIWPVMMFKYRDFTTETSIPGTLDQHGRSSYCVPINDSRLLLALRGRQLGQRILSCRR
jgi:hypothetical protein